MIVNELRIGNYIHCSENHTIQEKSINQIKSICYKNGELLDYIELEDGSRVDVEDAISCIPLTEEWLLKFGFKNKSIDYYTKDNFKERRININIDGLWLDDNGFFVTIENYSVHELQNVYFAYTGQELKIIIRNHSKTT